MSETMLCIYCGKLTDADKIVCSDICQKDMNEQFKRAMDAVEKHEKEIHEYNSDLLLKLNIPYGDFDDVLDGATITGKIEIVNHPMGSNNHDEIGFFKSIWVDQYSVGMEGDSWAGHIYAEFEKGKWLKIPYEC